MDEESQEMVSVGKIARSRLAAELQKLNKTGRAVV
jgi:hypothetical protein